MLRNQRARALMVVLGLALALVVVCVLVTRGSAITVQQAPYATTLTMNPSTSYVVAVPLRQPVTIAISDSGGGSYGTGQITACCDGVSWSWIGLNGNGSLAKGGNVKVALTPMCFAYSPNQKVRVYSPTTGTIQFYNAYTYPMRCYVEW